MELGWLVALALAAFLYGARRDLGKLRARFSAQASGQEPGEEAAGKQQRALTAAFALVILRLQLKRMHQGGELDESNFLALTGQIDTAWNSDPQGGKPPEDSALWWSACETGWNILTARGLVPYGPPPWPGRAIAPESHEVAVPASTEIAAAVEEREAAPSSQTLPSPPERPEPAAKTRPREGSPVTGAGAEAMPGGATVAERQAGPAAPSPGPAAPAKLAPTAREHAWRPAAPGPLEKALRVVSGWPKILVPFLIQNIGWFIGGVLPAAVRGPRSSEHYDA